jgi:hypothetical protein
MSPADWIRRQVAKLFMNYRPIKVVIPGREIVTLRAGFILVLTIVAVGGLGCAMCCSPDLESYPTIGGRVERSDPVLGRAGSNLSDPWMESPPEETAWLESEITPSFTDQTVQEATQPRMPDVVGTSTQSPRQPAQNGRKPAQNGWR